MCPCPLQVLRRQHKPPRTTQPTGRTVAVRCRFASAWGLDYTGVMGVTASLLQGEVPWFAALAIASAVVLLLLIGILLGFRLRRFWISKNAQRRTRHGLQRETEARAVLQAAGYRIVAEQQAQPWPVVAGDEWINVTLKADFVVERNGQRFVADAKTGAARWVRSTATRRQLLEYLIAYDVDAALLVDMEERRIINVAFPALV
jgi:hypothetical protein